MDSRNQGKQTEAVPIRAWKSTVQLGTALVEYDENGAVVTKMELGDQELIEHVASGKIVATIHGHGLTENGKITNFKPTHVELVPAQFFESKK